MVGSPNGKPGDACSLRSAMLLSRGPLSALEQSPQAKFHSTENPPAADTTASVETALSAAPCP